MENEIDYITLVTTEYSNRFQEWESEEKHAYHVKKDEKWNILELKRFLDNILMLTPESYSDDATGQNLYVLSGWGRKGDGEIYDIWQKQISE